MVENVNAQSLRTDASLSKVSKNSQSLPSIKQSKRSTLLTHKLPASKSSHKKVINEIENLKQSSEVYGTLLEKEYNQYVNSLVRVGELAQELLSTEGTEHQGQEERVPPEQG